MQFNMGQAGSMENQNMGQVPLSLPVKRMLLDGSAAPMGNGATIIC